MNNNSIVYQARLHWILFLWPSLAFFLTVYIGMTYEFFYQPSLLFALLMLLWFLMMWVTYQFSSLIIKKKQIVLRTGVIIRQTVDVPMNKIECIDIRQSVLGSLLGYGSLVITGTGGTKQIINYLSKPLSCRRHIEQLMHA